MTPPSSTPCREGKEANPWTVGPWEARAFAIYGGAQMRDRIAHTGGGLPPSRVRESEANARLIAAAPELYEALDGLATLVATEALFPPELAALVKARAALAKARGATA